MLVKKGLRLASKYRKKFIRKTGTLVIFRIEVKTLKFLKKEVLDGESWSTLT